MRSERLSRDATQLIIAQVIAERGTCRRKKVGAVLAKEGRILSTGYVGAPSGLPHCDESNCDPGSPCRRTIHAEANTIAWAARNGVATEGSTLYTTLSPCIDCAKLIINAGIELVIYSELYRDPAPIDLLHEVGIGTIHLSSRELLEELDG
jgi:dCMP deaminase